MKRLGTLHFTPKIIATGSIVMSATATPPASSDIAVMPHVKKNEPAEGPQHELEVQPAVTQAMLENIVSGGGAAQPGAVGPAQRALPEEDTAGKCERVIGSQLEPILDEQLGRVDVRRGRQHGRQEEDEKRPVKRTFRSGNGEGTPPRPPMGSSPGNLHTSYGPRPRQGPPPGLKPPAASRRARKCDSGDGSDQKDCIQARARAVQCKHVECGSRRLSTTVGSACEISGRHLPARQCVWMGRC